MGKIQREFVYEDITFFSRQISTIRSRFSGEICLRTHATVGGIGTGSNRTFESGILMSSPMLDVSGPALCSYLNNQGYTGILHRFMSEADHASQLISVLENSNSKHIAFSVGIHDCESKIENFKKIAKNYPGYLFLICIDTANGSNTLIEKPIRIIKEAASYLGQYDIDIAIMAGNIVTREAAEYLYNLGVQFVRVGIGGGSVCTTPMATGIFRPVVSAIMEIDEWRIKAGIRDFYIVADGGIKGAADVMKALAVGADFVMLGSLFAGFDLSASPLLVQGKDSNYFPLEEKHLAYYLNKGYKLYKFYRGMASAAMAEVNNQVNNINKKIIPEGVATTISYKGSFKDWLEEFEGSLKSSMSYCNARTIEEFRANVEIVEVTAAGNNLRKPHQLDK